MDNMYKITLLNTIGCTLDYEATQGELCLQNVVDLVFFMLISLTFFSFLISTVFDISYFHSFAVSLYNFMD